LVLRGPAAAFASVCLRLSVDDVVDLLAGLLLERPSLVTDSDVPTCDDLLVSWSTSLHETNCLKFHIQLQ